MFGILPNRGSGVRYFFALLVCLAPLVARAQVDEVSGGTSSLFQAQGGSLTITVPNKTIEMSAGMYAGHFEYGAQIQQKIGRYKYVVGDDHINFTLPTDIFDGAHFLYTRGYSASRHEDGNDFFAFAGVDSEVLSNPLFLGGKFGTGLGFLAVRHQVTDHLQFFSDTVITRKQSEIVALEWTPKPKMALSVSGGIGANQPYGAVSFAYTRPWFSVKSGYIQAGSNFRRFMLTNPVLSEPVKENIAVTVSPVKNLTFLGSVQNYVVPLSATSTENVGSSSNQAGVNFHAWKTNVSGTLYESKFEGEENRAASAVFQRDLTRHLKLSGTYMLSKPQSEKSTSSGFLTLTEGINQRLSLNQNVNLSTTGSPQFFYGGSFDSNLFSISANYETYYLPTRPGNPFENALMLEVTMRVFGRYRLHGQTNLSPTGALLYTADVYGVASRGESLKVRKQDVGIDRNMIRIRVVDDRGEPVEGIAFLIDEQVVYSGSEGTCFIRERSAYSHKFRVALDQSMTDGLYTVVSAPTTVKSSPSDAEPETLVVLKRVLGEQGGGGGGH